MTAAVSELPLRDILHFDHSILVDLASRTDNYGIPLAQWMFDHGLEVETAITALEDLCRNGPPNIEFIEWIVMSFKLKFSDIDQDGCPDCIMSACQNGYDDLIKKMVVWFDILQLDSRSRLCTGIEMIVSLVNHYLDTNSLDAQRTKGYPMIKWLIKTIDLKSVLPHDEELRDLVYEMAGEDRPVDLTCQLLKV